MKAVIFSFIPCVETSMVASTKVARFISEKLDLPLIWNASIGEHRNLDALIIVNGAYAFCKHLEELSHAILGAKRIIWVQQDYTIVPPINDGMATSPFRKAFVERRSQGKPHLEYWTTCAKESKLTPFSSYINWNCLSMVEMKHEKYERPPVLVYYGSFREGRHQYFHKFFSDPKVDIVISSPSNKFEKAFTSPRICHCAPPENLLDFLSKYGLGLYLEDRKSHQDFHSPPNRFYEMLSAGLPMIFQQEAEATLAKAGYKDVNKFSVSMNIFLQDKVREKMDVREIIAASQRDLWYALAMAERKDLPKAVKKAWMKLKENL